MSYCRQPLSLTILLFIALFTSHASLAQSTVPQEQAQAFVRAALAVSEIDQAWQQRINDAKSEVEAERLREQASIAMRKAIQEVDDMTIDRYRAMYYEAKRNPELAAYLTDLLEQEVAGQ